jgi:hypothetical protein
VMSSPDWFWHRIEQRMHPDLKRRPYDCGFERLVDLWAEAIEQECSNTHLVTERGSKPTGEVKPGASRYWGLKQSVDDGNATARLAARAGPIKAKY